MNELSEPIDAVRTENEETAGAAPVIARRRRPEQARPAAQPFRAMHVLPEAAGMTPASADYILF